MRTKKVTVGEENYVVGKLSCGQVDEIVFAEFEIRADRTQIVTVVSGSKRAVRTRLCPVIAASMNNVTMGSAEWFLDGWDKPASFPVLDPPAKWWTGDAVFTELGYDEMVQLYEAVAVLSGLKVTSEKEKAKAKPAGESPAADAPTIS